MIQIMLVGNPNCGKTTLFNALTGDTQRVGNWSGVTVEKKTGSFSNGQQTVQVTDLPGTYSLSTSSHCSQDMQITANAVAFETVDIFVNVIDACHLERHLYLTTQLLELGKPVIIALNMMDIASQRGITIDTKQLSSRLGCPVIALEAHRNVGVADLKSTIISLKKITLPSFKMTLPLSIRETIELIEKESLTHGYESHLARYIALRILEGDTFLPSCIKKIDVSRFVNHEADVDILLADARYQTVHELVESVQVKRSDVSESFTAKIDRIVLHRFWAIPIFFSIMYGMFFLAINVGGKLQDFFDTATDAVFVQGVTQLLNQLNAPQWLVAVCGEGIGKGINTTLTFIPVLACMYFLLALLESSGYMARAAFIVDRAMRFLGLPGKAFVPMIVGFGCNVPAIMAARTLNSERDRILTILMSPFMSCSARLAIYSVFVAAFFPVGGQNIVFSLYLIGILMAVLTGFLLRKTLFKGQVSSLILELPVYHRPTLKRLCHETSVRLTYFLVRAGKLIIPICAILGGLNAWTLHKSTSILAVIGQWLTPLFSPMGLQPDNWPATVGLLTGMLAKEVVIGTLNSLYTQIGHDSHVLSVMNSYFTSKASAYAYLLFILLYIPCVSTMAAIRQETNRKLMWFSIGWSLLIAYLIAVLFYQIATFYSHPEQSILWICVFILVFGGLIRLFSHGGRYVTATS